MKKVFLLIVIFVGLAMVIVAADFRAIPDLLQPPPEKNCSGYTIIEFDKAINCQGDTVKLVRKHGYAELVDS